MPLICWIQPIIALKYSDKIFRHETSLRFSYQKHVFLRDFFHSKLHKKNKYFSSFLLLPYYIKNIFSAIIKFSWNTTVLFVQEESRENFSLFVEKIKKNLVGVFFSSELLGNFYHIREKLNYLSLLFLDTFPSTFSVSPQGKNLPWQIVFYVVLINRNLCLFQLSLTKTYDTRYTEKNLFPPFYRR